MYSQTVTSSNVTTVAKLNILIQKNTEIIEINDNIMTSNNHSPIDSNIYESNNKSTITSLMSLGHEQQRDASFNAAQQRAQVTLSKEQLRGDRSSLRPPLCMPN